MTLDAIQARAEAATEGPWRALGAGAAGGDHWYICDDGEAIASVSAQDGINEDQREPDAEFIAHARTDIPALVKALRAVEAAHSAATIHVITGDCATEQCDHDGPTECDTRPMELCSACVDLAESVYDYALENGVEHVTYPCPTITAIREALG